MCYLEFSLEFQKWTFKEEYNTNHSSHIKDTKQENGEIIAKACFIEPSTVDLLDT